MLMHLLRHDQFCMGINLALGRHRKVVACALKKQKDQTPVGAVGTQNFQRERAGGGSIIKEDIVTKGSGFRQWLQMDIC